MIQSYQVSPIFTPSPPNIIKSAFTQLNPLDTLQRYDHKTNRSSSCQSNLQPSLHHDKNYHDESNNNLSNHNQIPYNKKSSKKYQNSIQTLSTNNKKIPLKKFVDSDNNSTTKNQNLQTNTIIIKGSWSKDQDLFLIQLVLENGAKNWSCIAKKMKGRMGKQCRQRWHNHLNPDIKKQKWTQQQDHKIIEYHRRFGNKWALISRYLPGRTDNAIKNHWNSTISRKLIQQHIPTSTIQQHPNQNLTHTPKKNKTNNQWNTANTFPYPQTPEQPQQKYLSYLITQPINLFSKKTMESEHEKSYKYNQISAKIGFVFPLLHEISYNSNYYLEQIQQTLQYNQQLLSI